MAFRGALVKKAADQTTANYSAGAVVGFDSEIYDTDGAHDTVTNNHRFTIPSAWNGAYGRLTATLSAELVTAGSTFYCLFRKGSSPSGAYIGASFNYTNSDGNGQATTSAWINAVSPPFPLVTGDIYQVFFICNDTSITVKAHSNFGIHVLDPVTANMGVLAVKNADQTGINGAVPFAVAWDGADIYDTHSIHDPSSNNTKLIVPSALNGKKAIIGAQIRTANHTGNHSIAIRKGGSLTYDGFAGFSPRPFGTAAGVSCFTSPITLATNDEFETFYYAGDGSMDIIAARSSMSLRVVE